MSISNIYIYKNDPRPCKCGKCNTECDVFLESEGLEKDGEVIFAPKSVVLGTISSNNAEGVSSNAYLSFLGEGGSAEAYNVTVISNYLYRVIPHCNCWKDQLTGKLPATILLCDNNLICSCCNKKIQTKVESNISNYSAYGYARRETDNTSNFLLTEADFKENAVLVLTNNVPLATDESNEVEPCCDCIYNSETGELHLNSDDKYFYIRGKNLPNNVIQYLNPFEYQICPTEHRINSNSRDIANFEKSKYKFFLKDYTDELGYKLFRSDNLQLIQTINAWYLSSPEPYEGRFEEYIGIVDDLKNVTTMHELIQKSHGQLFNPFEDINVTTEQEFVDFVNNNDYISYYNESDITITDLSSLKEAFADTFFLPSATRPTTVTEVVSRLVSNEQYSEPEDLSSITTVSDLKDFISEHWLYTKMGGKNIGYTVKDIWLSNNIYNYVSSPKDLSAAMENVGDNLGDVLDVLYQEKILFDSDFTVNEIPNAIEYMKEAVLDDTYSVCCFTNDYAFKVAKIALKNAGLITENDILNISNVTTDVTEFCNDLNDPEKKTNVSYVYGGAFITKKEQEIILNLFNNEHYEKYNGSTNMLTGRYVLLKKQQEEDLGVSSTFINYDSIYENKNYEQLYKNNEIYFGSNSFLNEHLYNDGISSIYDCYKIYCSECNAPFTKSSSFVNLEEQTTYKRNPNCSCVGKSIKAIYDEDTVIDNIENGRISSTLTESDVKTILSNNDYNVTNAIECLFETIVDDLSESAKTYPVKINEVTFNNNRYTNNKTNLNDILTKSTSDKITVVWGVNDITEDGTFTPIIIEDTTLLEQTGYTTVWTNSNEPVNYNKSLYFTDGKSCTINTIYAPVVGSGGCGSEGISNSILGPWDKDGNNLNECTQNNMYSYYESDEEHLNIFKYRYAIEVDTLDYVFGSYIEPQPEPVTPDKPNIIRYYLNDYVNRYTSAAVYSNTIDVSKIK